MSNTSPFTQQDWANIDTVLLDMDGTLLDLHFDNYFWLQHVPEKFAERFNTSKEEATQQVITATNETKGTLQWYCLDYWTDRLNLPIAELKKDIEHKIAYRPFVHDFLAMLKQQGKRAVIVTNAHRDSVDLKMAKTGLDKLVDRVISSHDYQEPKESQQFWRHLQKDEPFENSRTLLIDDSQAVLKSAQTWGIGYLLTIYHPDSKQQPNTDSEHLGVHHFDSLIDTHREQ